ncbi:hypothetical protein M3Y96_00292800 [Aphelenchoides besseyi]|nr:hypothetical protein M3Y96_00292800 [Aphelenchoides besseyi]
MRFDCSLAHDKVIFSMQRLNLLSTILFSISAIQAINYTPEDENSNELIDSTETESSDVTNKQQIVPFVRYYENGPQVVEMLIGTPPQKLKIALTYESIGYLCVSDIVLFSRKTVHQNCKKGIKGSPKLYVPKKSRTHHYMHSHSGYTRLYWGAVHEDTIALGTDSSRMQKHKFVIAETFESNFSCTAEVAGVWPISAFAKEKVWLPILKSKSMPIVTMSADRNPTISGVYSTGQMTIGGLNEKTCKKTDVYQYGGLQWHFGALSYMIGKKQVPFVFKWDEFGALDLNVDRLQFGHEHLDMLLKGHKVNRNHADGFYYGDCNGNWTIGYQAAIKSSLPHEQDGGFIYIPSKLKKQKNNQCALRLEYQSGFARSFKLPASILHDHCIHLKYESQDNNKIKDVMKYKFNDIAFSKRIDKH